MPGWQMWQKCDMLADALGPRHCILPCVHCVMMCQLMIFNPGYDCDTCRLLLLLMMMISDCFAAVMLVPQEEYTKDEPYEGEEYYKIGAKKRTTHKKNGFSGQWDKVGNHNHKSTTAAL